MSRPLHAQLLSHARGIASRKRASEADARRAVSAAYYALFHLLIDEVIDRVFGDASMRQHHRHLRRTFEHSTMTALCRWLVHQVAKLPEPPPQQPSAVRAIWDGHVPSDELVNVARVFVDLQELRLKADYDLSERFNAASADAEVLRVEGAFESWHTIRSTEEAGMFAVSMVLTGPLRQRRSS